LVRTAALLVLAVAAAGLCGQARPQAKAAPNRYMGTSNCKNCHEAKSKGAQFSKWKETKHAKAYEILGTEEAKKVGRERGIPDPQKSEVCLKCHVTGHGEAADRFDKAFNPKLGIQCESCHGPGERHFKARFAAAAEAQEEHVEIPPDEIVMHPGTESCLKCHNEESPQFKPFCFKKRFEEMQHLDPRKERTPDQVKSMKCGCAGACACKKGECGGIDARKQE
jgi:hypothetical protein